MAIVGMGETEDTPMSFWFMALGTDMTLCVRRMSLLWRRQGLFLSVGTPQKQPRRLEGIQGTPVSSQWILPPQPRPPWIDQGAGRISL